MARHDEIVRDAIESHDGHVVKTTGDGFHAAFATARRRVGRGVVGAADASAGEPPVRAACCVKVRMGVHTGEARVRDGDYYGSALNRAARLMAVGHGGQIVCSQATADLARDELAEGVALVDLGEHRLRDLSQPERVFQVNAPGLMGTFAPLRSVDAFPGNLPLQVSSFVGRERELARVVKALDDARVVTLTGVGGVGKTRLALQVAAEVLPGFREGAWLVELAPVRDPDGVVDAFAAVFGVSARAGQSVEESLVEFLRTKQLLLVVDNCEHLLEAVADLVETLERSCAGVVVLATSREGLSLDGEQNLTVPSLAAPAVDADLETIAQSDAVVLFVQRAQRADADFALTPENAAAVVEVCRRLDGVPLAIELAAAQVTTMSPAELARGLDRRFDTLAGGRRRAVQRHQTLRAAIDWSYDLCSEPERRLLARMSVFAGGATRDAVEAVCAGDPIDGRAVFGLLSRSGGPVVGRRATRRPRHPLPAVGDDPRVRRGTPRRPRRDRHVAVPACRVLPRLRACRHRRAAGATPGRSRTSLRGRTREPAQRDEFRGRPRRRRPRPGAPDRFVLGRSRSGTSCGSRPTRSDSTARPSIPSTPKGSPSPPSTPRCAAIAWTQTGSATKPPTAARRLGSDPDRLVDAVGRATPASRWRSRRERSTTQPDSRSRMAEIGRATGRLYDVASGLAAAATWHTMAGDPDTALPLATEGLAVARRLGNPSLHRVEPRRARGRARRP